MKVEGHQCISGWKSIAETIKTGTLAVSNTKMIVVVDCYHGVYTDEIIDNLSASLKPSKVFDVSEILYSEEAIKELTYPYVTEDPVFGCITPLSLADFFDKTKLSEAQKEIDGIENGIVLVLGIGASLIYPHPNILIYADMARWEIQLRYRKNKVSNLGAKNFNDEFSYKYKRSFFVDWRVLDRHKVSLMDKWHFVLDTTKEGEPKLVTGQAIRDALKQTVQRPFRVVPFFDPGPWGGQWLKEVCDLDRSVQNFAWGFDCVPEENSLLLQFGETTVEIPSINLVFSHPEALLGKKVYDAFGAEFPIRFDFLDTMEGGNLSLQVHPLKEYIREKFGMAYTQDESYYMLDAKDGAFVYLGLKENIVPEDMLNDLEKAQEKDGNFDADKYVEKFRVKKHDHILIPSGTVHCSGADSVVLEISATPFIFTFKLWDWGRMGLDGKPRPISLEHGKKAIQWNRTTKWTKENILNKVQSVNEGEGWKEERTGLDETSFIETRRHWFTQKVPHNTGGVVNVLNLIEGAEAIVESPTGAFLPFVIHFAETFIVPASVGDYTIRPYGKSEGQQCATIKAYVRTQNLNDFKLV